MLWSLYEGCVPRVCIGYITNGFNDFATVDGNGLFLRNCLCFEEREQCLKVLVAPVHPLLIHFFSAVVVLMLLNGKFNFPR